MLVTSCVRLCVQMCVCIVLCVLCECMCSVSICVCIDYATPKYSAFKPREMTTRCSASTGERPSRYTLAAAHIPIPRATHFSRSRSACRRAGIIPYSASFAPVKVACMALNSTVLRTLKISRSMSFLQNICERQRSAETWSVGASATPCSNRRDTVRTLHVVACMQSNTCRPGKAGQIS